MLKRWGGLHGRYAGSAVRMDEGEVEEGLEWLEDRFHVIRYEDDELPSVDWVLDLARAAVLRCWPPMLLSLSLASKLQTSAS